MDRNDFTLVLSFMPKFYLSFVIHAKTTLQVFRRANDKRYAIKHNLFVLPHYATILRTDTTAPLKITRMTEKKKRKIKVTLTRPIFLINILLPTLTTLLTKRERC